MCVLKCAELEKQILTLHNNTYKTMATMGMQRQSIELPTDIFKKLSALAMCQGKSLKSYIESVLTSTANTDAYSVSPSGDEWYADKENMDAVKKGVEQYKNGETRRFSIGEIRSLLGV
nr:hypothetical protein WMHIBSEC_WMHIBSEC_CDS_0020 [Caudoviricetes sp.]CAI9751694.1 hypothetical protein AZFZUZMX_AZFZUZMX_CDS_0020 [Caudoviricetes sp.]